VGTENAPSGSETPTTFYLVDKMLQELYEDIYPRFVRTRVSGQRAGDGVGSHLSLKFELEAIQEIRDQLKFIQGTEPALAVMDEEQHEALREFLLDHIGQLTERIKKGDDPIENPVGSLACLVAERGIYQKVLGAFG
jgi:hypothetical protein